VWWARGPLALAAMSCLCGEFPLGNSGVCIFKKLPKEDPTPFGVGFVEFTVKIAAELV